MSSKYEKSISMEQEGTYHRRKIDTVPPKTYTTQSYQVVPAKVQSVTRHKTHHHDTSDDDNDNFEEWTTSKRKVDHKTRQVETRVSRQLLVEDGKVIADSGPQVTTRIKEDNKVEECEKEKTPKNKSKFDALENAPEGESTGRILGEKKEIQKKVREIREENMHYHDERFKELTGQDVHRRAIQAPHELITITDKNHTSAPRGKMVHYSNKGKTYRDTDEILEVAKLAIDGSVTKEVKRTKHHEESSDTERPDESGEAEALRKKPIVTRSSRRHVDYVNDFDDTSTPKYSSDDEVSNEDSRYHTPAINYGSRSSHRSSAHKLHHKTGHHKENEAFPRYEIDPLLNSLKDEDFKPITTSNNNNYRSGTHYRDHSLERKDYSSDNDIDNRNYSSHHSSAHQHAQRSQSPYSSNPRTPIEIPEEYRVNKQRLRGGKSSGGHQKERSFSPTSKSHLSQASHRSSKSHGSHKEDAAVQAHLTDEELERKSLSSSSGNEHENKTRHLQRQSTANSSRNYYFGERRHRPASVYSSSSTSSSSDAKERLRKHGARSKDSGFRSPQSIRTTTPISTGSQQQIYSVSNNKSKKSHRHHQDDDNDRTIIPGSPTPTTGSLGQRSVKTTTTTLAAGLADRPGSPVKPARSKRSTTLPAKTTPVNQSKTATKTADKRTRADGSKVSRTPSPFQKLAKLFAPSSQKSKQVAT